MYKRKTLDEWFIIGDYGQGFEEVCCYSTYSEAKIDIKLYRENEKGIAFKIGYRRIKI